MDDKTIEIKQINNHKKRFLDLLLLADEQEDMIDRYLERGDMFALYDGDLKSICLVTEESDDVCELKNLATYRQYQRQGYGKKLVEYLFKKYETRYKTMLVGTGEISEVISFYKHCGFTVSHRIPRFFIENYDHPIFENGKRLVDMIYLRKDF